MLFLGQNLVLVGTTLLLANLTCWFLFAGTSVGFLWNLFPGNAAARGEDSEVVLGSAGVWTSQNIFGVHWAVWPGLVCSSSYTGGLCRLLEVHMVDDSGKLSTEILSHWLGGEFFILITSWDLSRAWANDIITHSFQVTHSKVIAMQFS